MGSLSRGRMLISLLIVAVGGTMIIDAAAAPSRLIPRVVYQTWATRPIPTAIERARKRMKSLNPLYQFEYFDDADCNAWVAKHYAGTPVADAFSKLVIGASRADLWRYLILHREGGVYVDADSEVVVGLDEAGIIRDGDSAVVSREPHRGSFVQWALVFAPGHPILARTIELAVERILNASATPGGLVRADVLETTGPAVYARGVEDAVGSLLAPLRRAGAGSVWEMSDTELNAALAASGTRFFGVDFNATVQFKFKDSDQAWLYALRPTWRYTQRWEQLRLLAPWLVAAFEVPPSVLAVAAVAACLLWRRICTSRRRNAGVQAPTVSLPAGAIAGLAATDHWYGKARRA